MRPSFKLHDRWVAAGIAVALAVVPGLVCLHYEVGGGLVRLSYDLPFALRKNIRVDDAVVVYMDENSHEQLGQPPDAPWDRSVHARLIECMITNQAKAVVMDILFTHPSTNNPAGDEALSRALAKNGKVVLAGNYFSNRGTQHAIVSKAEVPSEKFRQAATWGNTRLSYDPDYGVRRHYPNLTNVPGHTNFPTLAWAVATLVGAPLTQRPEAAWQSRWMNYYGPPGWLPNVPYFVIFEPDGVPPGYFKDKVVFVGTEMSADFSGKGKDEFATPYTRWGKGFAPGVDMHATAFLNLWRGDWLTRAPELLEAFFLAVVGVVLGLGLLRMHPVMAALVAAAVAVLISALALLLSWRFHVWFAWMIPVGLQLPTAFAWSIVFNSIKLYVDKRLLERSLEFHLPPGRVTQILDNPALLKPGAEEMRVSLLFSDIAGFSKITERMDAEDLFRLLNNYYEASLRAIHETDGTVMNLVGDAIFAIWNAPFPQTDHAERACRAALLLQSQLVEFDRREQKLPLRTRVGLHTGRAYIGNLGSSTRFEYAAVGDDVNMSSRLEGLNKYLGTSVLATREIQKAVEKTLLSRLVGFFKFKGLDRVVEVHELLGTLEQEEAMRSWREAFGKGMFSFQRKEFDEAEKWLRRTLEARPDDSPARFYLQQIADLRQQPLPYDWAGEISLKDK